MGWRTWMLRSISDRGCFACLLALPCLAGSRMLPRGGPRLDWVIEFNWFSIFIISRHLDSATLRCAFRCLPVCLPCLVMRSLKVGVCILLFAGPSLAAGPGPGLGRAPGPWMMSCISALCACAACGSSGYVVRVRSRNGDSMA